MIKDRLLRLGSILGMNKHLWLLFVLLVICMGLQITLLVEYKLAAMGPAMLETRTISPLRYNCSEGHVDRCFEKPHKIIIEPDDLCGDEDADLVVFIVSTREHFWRRQIQRKSISDQIRASGLKIRHTFVFGTMRGDTLTLGRTDDVTSQKGLLKEAEEYGDIMQGDFEEVYENNVFKARTAFQYFTEKCSRAKYFMKADDDMIINFNLIFTYVVNNVTKQLGLKRFMLGKCDLSRDLGRHRQFFRIHNRLDADVYPDLYLPQCCSGGSYVMAPEVVHDLAEAVKYVPIILVEDAYTGVCISRLRRPVAFVDRHNLFIMQYYTHQSLRICDQLANGDIYALHSKHGEGLDHFTFKCLGQYFT